MPAATRAEQLARIQELARKIIEDGEEVPEGFNAYVNWAGELVDLGQELAERVRDFLEDDPGPVREPDRDDIAYERARARGWPD